MKGEEYLIVTLKGVVQIYSLVFIIKRSCMKKVTIVIKLQDEINEEQIVDTAFRNLVDSGDVDHYMIVKTEN